MIGAVALLVLEEALPCLIGLVAIARHGQGRGGRAANTGSSILGPMLLLIVLFARGGIDGILAGLRRA